MKEKKKKSPKSTEAAAAVTAKVYTRTLLLARVLS